MRWLEVDLPMSPRVSAVMRERSPILGRPMAMMPLARDATRLVQGSWIKPGAVVTDAGSNARTVGDVDFEPRRREH